MNSPKSEFNLDHHQIFDGSLWGNSATKADRLLPMKEDKMQLLYNNLAV